METFWEKSREGKEKGNEFIERRVEKKKTFGYEILQQNIDNSKGNKTGPNARIKLFGELDLALANVISLQDV